MIIIKYIPIVFLLILLVVTTNKPAFADILKPTPQEIMKAQLKHDPDIFKKYTWVQPSDINQFAKNRVIIVSNVFVTNLSFDPPGSKDEEGNELDQKHSDHDQLYRLSYRIFSTGFYDITCNDKEELIKKIYTKEEFAKEKIKDEFRTDTYFIRYTQNGKFSMERNGDEVMYSQFPNYLAGNQLDKNTSGFIYMVQVEDFIKDINAINLDKLCEGQPQKKKDLMKWALNNLHEFYKTKYADWKRTAKPDRK
ncbi:MAG: hypothetical protein HQK52_11395 [Oligoflexia bacterium]|nr:hypothetical protein [Oligoflexia bacterium]